MSLEKRALSDRPVFSDEALTGGTGWLPGLLRRPSPFCDDRPEGVEVDLLVIHHISLPAGCFSGEAVDRLFTGAWREGDPPDVRGLRVSAHFFVRRSGEVRQYVDVRRRAWHAGVSNFRGRSACNNFSVGVELEGTGEVPYEAAQYEALGTLAQRLARLLPLRFVTGHEHIAPGRKTDPGPSFDWARLGALMPPELEIAVSPAESFGETLVRRFPTLS